MKGNDKFILDDENNAVPVDLMTWAVWLENAGERRRVGYDTLADGVVVSTIFIGLDHSWGGVQPLIFETYVIGGSMDGEMERYSTWGQAEAGHKNMVTKVRETL